MPDVEDESLAEGWLAACTGSGVVASVMEIYGGGKPNPANSICRENSRGMY